MNQYLIRHHVATVAHFTHPFSFGGFDVDAYGPDYWNSPFWIFSKKIKAINIKEALDKFRNEFIVLVQKLSVVSQCAFRINGNSFLVYKENNNPENVVYVFCVFPVKPTGLMVAEEEIKQLGLFNKINQDKSLVYLSEAANTTSYYGRLSLLIMAAEAFAGEKKRKVDSKFQYYINHKELKKILGTTLHTRLYNSGNGLRNILFHGKLDDHSIFSGLTKEVYSALVEHLNRMGLDINTKVVDPLRGFDSHVANRNFWQFSDKVNLSLKDIEDDLSEENRRKRPPSDNRILTLFVNDSYTNKY